MLLPQQDQPLPGFDGDLLGDVDVEIRTGVRVHGLGTLEDDNLPLPTLPLNEPRFGALGKVEIFPQPVLILKYSMMSPVLTRMGRVYPATAVIGIKTNQHESDYQ